MYNRAFHVTLLVILIAGFTAPAHLFAQKVGCQKYKYILGKQNIPEMPKYWMGYGLACMDVNKDGYTDVLASAVGPNTVFVYFGGRGIFDTTADLELRGGGEMVTGDFNGDGLTDLAVRRPNYLTAEKTEPSYDSFYVYMGVSDSMYALETQARFVVSAPIDGLKIDKSIIGDILLAGDLDGDGKDELIMAGRQYNREELTGVFSGGLFVWRYPRGDDSDTVTSIRLTDAFSGAVRSIQLGDINGDGIADLAVAIKEYADVGVSKPPIIRVSYGKPGRYPDLSNPEQIFSIDVLKYSRDTYVNRLSEFWVTLLDVNRDGLTDLTWVPCKDSLLVMYGTPEGLSGTVDRIIVNPDTNRWYGFGYRHHQIGDHNGDGHDDYILAMGTEDGNWPASLVFAGNTYGLTNQPISVCVGGGKMSGRYIFNMGDLDGDGADEHIASEPVAPGSVAIQEPGYCIIVQSAFWVKVGVDAEFDAAESPAAPFSVEVYPSPSSGDINIMLHGESPGAYQLRLHSLEGKTILTRNYDLINSGNVLIIPAHEIPAAATPAVYFVELTHAGNTVRRKVMVSGK